MQVSVQHNELVLSFPYNEELIAKVRAVPGSRFDKKTKTWRFLLTPWTWKQVKTRLKVECKELDIALSTMPVIDLKKHRFKTKPYDHQIEGLTVLLRHFGMEVRNVKESSCNTETASERKGVSDGSGHARRSDRYQPADKRRDKIDI